MRQNVGNLLYPLINPQTIDSAILRRIPPYLIEALSA